MARYIDADELLKDLEGVTNDVNCPLHIAAEIDQTISLFPTADVVEVVKVAEMFAEQIGDFPCNVNDNAELLCVDCDCKCSMKCWEQFVRLYGVRKQKNDFKESYMKRCNNYCGVACVDGSCPIANREEYAERGCDLINSCDDCNFYKGCKDCAFDDTAYCPKFNNNDFKE